MKVTSCKYMQYLFHLHQLKNIEISDCEQLEQVFGDKEQDAQTMRFEL